MTRFITPLTLLTLLAAAAAPPVAQSRSTGLPGSATAAAAQDTSVDGGWPRAYISPSGSSILIYQPQVGSWFRVGGHR